MSILSLQRYDKRQKFVVVAALCGFVVLIAVGAMASNNWLPHTDPLTGKKTGWFGKELPKNASSSWNPLAAPLPTPTPQLSRELIYANERLLAQVDSQSQELPPADLAIWRQSTGYYWVMSGSASGNYSNYYAVGWGVNGDIPVPGDFDGDGKTDFSIFRPSTGEWYVNRSSDGSYFSTTFGVSTDIPKPADFDGDGKTDLAVFRPSNGVWYILRSSDNTYTYPTLGTSGDTPDPADFDGDGKADIAVWHPGDTTLTSKNIYTGVTSSHNFSAAASDPVSADYDGDGRADYAIRQSGSSNWIIFKSSTFTTDTIAWQNSSDKQVRNDYDADGKCDIATWRDSNGTWYIRPSGNPNTARTVQFGASGDKPVPAYYRR